ISASPLKYQSNSGPTSSPASAMKPSTDTTACITTVLTPRSCPSLATKLDLLAQPLELGGVAYCEDPADPPVLEGEADHRVDGAVEQDAGAGRTVEQGRLDHGCGGDPREPAEQIDDLLRADDRL